MNLMSRCVAAAFLLASAVAADAQALPPVDLATLLSQDLELGPLKLTFGPQESGDFGAVLNGNATRAVPSLNYVPPPAQQNSPFTARYGAIEFNVDAGWNSASDALNQTTLAVRPSVTFVWLDGAKAPVPLSPELQQTCRDLSQQGQRAIERSLVDPSVKAEADAEIARVNAARKELGCEGRVGEPPSSQWAVAVYPDVQYRFGEFEINGERFNANQLITGLAARLFVPGTSDSAWFREWPRLSLGYYTVSDSEDSTIPLPESIDEDHIRTSARIAMNVPFFGTSLAKSPLRLDIEATASRATSGEDDDWQVLRQFQLYYDTGDTILPALTYRSGTDLGIVYDKQVILGLLWMFAAPKN
jgi:hypothetical protein